MIIQNVSRETMGRLRVYGGLIEKWTPKINLIAPSTRDRLWQRHIEDSAQLFALAPRAGHWADLGSGGGLPGIVVAIIALERTPEMRFTLVESDKRKAAFCRTALRELDLNATVACERIEKLPPLNADVVSARALAPLDRLLWLASPHLKPDGTALFLKGANHDSEIKEALASWRASVEKIPSRTDPKGVILKVGDIARA
jgi:16S rRNA (guanine527-N7)-methyltransferase